MKGSKPQQTQVTLVGAGPGDPDLLTLRAVRAIENADVIIYDNLVSEGIRELFPSDVTQLYVGKAKNCHSYTQKEINQTLLDQALAGKTVCRVKGGDAFVFGRGGEEMLWLAQHGIEVSVVPGITAASGCTTYADIPLTHRGLAQSCTFITAHAEKSLEVKWRALAELNQTIVIYMGLSKAQWISDNLIESGMAATTPVAIIEKGCCPEQRTYIGQLSDLEQIKQQHRIQSPALIVIGKVVTVAEQMQWLSQLNTRAAIESGTAQNKQQKLKLSA
ncbi:uroporphyrinogen-III C-methyltransferase [Vibrio hippocampi]|nr:uroporphyrinogen-III C-methyltransferase [Vibrio hippocampi]